MRFFYSCILLPTATANCALPTGLTPVFQQLFHLQIQENARLL
jgi:hypothetical protein